MPGREISLPALLSGRVDLSGRHDFEDMKDIQEKLNKQENLNKQGNQDAQDKIRLVSVIVSVFNEEGGLRQFYDAASKVLSELKEGVEPLSYELLFVNDGSLDGSGRILAELKAEDPEHVSVISFSRNFGHEAAMTAGLDYASGDVLIFMDADLQHPPKLIPDIIGKFSEGYQIVNMVRTKNESAGLVKNICSRAFYSIINLMSDMHIEPSASDFFAMDKAAASVLRSNYREKVRFLRGYVQNIGFRKTVLEYEAGERSFGKSHYSFKRLWRLSMDTLVCFSDVPLKLGMYAGFFSALVGVLLILYTLITRGTAPGGYATIVIALCFMFAVLFIIVGVIGEYISVIFKEIKDRPIYIISDMELSKAHTEQALPSEGENQNI